MTTPKELRVILAEDVEKLLFPISGEPKCESDIDFTKGRKLAHNKVIKELCSFAHTITLEGLAGTVAFAMGQWILTPTSERSTIEDYIATAIMEYIQKGEQ